MTTAVRGHPPFEQRLGGSGGDGTTLLRSMYERYALTHRHVKPVRCATMGETRIDETPSGAYRQQSVPGKEAH